eukprot:403332405
MLNQINYRIHEDEDNKHDQLQDSKRFKRSPQKQDPSLLYLNHQQHIEEQQLLSDDGRQMFDNVQEYQDRDEFEQYDSFLRSNQQSTAALQNSHNHYNSSTQQPFQQLDSERSNFTQESCSPPDSTRDPVQNNVKSSQQMFNQREPLNIRDLTHKLEEMEQQQKIRNKNTSSNNSMSQSESDNFTLMNNNSPGKESLLQSSFHAQQTSSFPNNLQNSSHFKLREVSTNSQENQLIQNSSPLSKQKQMFLSQGVDQSKVQQHQEVNNYLEGQLGLSITPSDHQRQLNSLNNNLNENQISQNSNSNRYTNQNPSESDSNRFNGSFYKFEGQKIKEFEKSTMIRFEEFNGGDSSQQESDPYRKQSERISDRIYERQEDHKTPSSIQITQDQQNTDEDNVNEELKDHFQIDENDNTYIDSPYNKERQMPLFIITEEDQSEIQSSYQTFNRMQSINSSQIDKNGAGNSGLMMNCDNQQYFNPSLSRDQSQNSIYSKSKSQPLRHQNKTKASQRFSQGRAGSSDNNIQDKVFKTDTSPALRQQNQLSPSFKDNANFFGSKMPYQHSRMLTESPLLGGSIDQDQVSQFLLQRIQNHPGHRPNMNSATNVSQPDFVMSDEDLLSNIDRVSKILPTNEISEDDIERPTMLSNIDETSVLQKMKEYKQMIEHLKCENQNKQTLILIKESQMNLLQHKNEQLEERINELEQYLSSNPESLRVTQRNKVETCTQVSQEDFGQSSERKKVRPRKNKQSLSQIKKTPQRSDDQHIYSDSNLIIQTGNQMSKQNSQTNVFDTPQIKLDQILRGESPSSLPKNTIGLSKHYSLSFNSDEVNNLRQQMVLIKQQLQRSEENNLNFQLKVEKQKKDKSEFKEKIFLLSIDKNDLQKSVESLAREIDEYEQKFEAMKLDITDYQRQVEILELKLKQKRNMIDRQLSARSLPMQYEQGIQTENNQQQQQFINTQGRKTPITDEDLNMYESQYNMSSNFSSQKQFVNPSLQTQPQLNINHPNTNNNITIINGRSNLGLLLGKAKDYEVISQQLQNEISEYKKIQRENAEKAQRIQQEQQDFQRKLKKRESKISKLKSVNKVLEKEKLELRVKLDESRQKIQELRLKMESKLQEKEFKIISIKNQMKHFHHNPSSSGIPTPGTPTINTTQFTRQNQLNQVDLYNLINQIVQQQIVQNPSVFNSGLMSKKLSNENLLKSRAKSHDQPYNKNNITTMSFYVDESPINTGLDEPRIITNPSNVVFYAHGENPSFSQIKQENGFNSPNSQNASNILYPYRKSLTISEQEDQNNQINLQNLNYNGNTSEIQHIFNSSLKRITNELDHIKDLNNGKVSSFNKEQQMKQLSKAIAGQQKFHRVPTKNKSQVQPISQKLINNYQHYEEIQRDLSPIQQNQGYNTRNINQSQYYDDSLQIHIADQREVNQYEDYNNDSNITNDPMVEQIIHLNNIQSSNTLDIRQNQNENQNRWSQQQNTQTFRKNSQVQNAQSSQMISQKKSNVKIELNEQNLFNNTYNNQDKEQNASIFYDFKPAFENSNQTIISNLNNSKSFIARQQPIEDLLRIQNKYESNKQSLNASLRTPAQVYQVIQHVRLQSNLMTRDQELDSLSPTSTDNQNLKEVQNSSHKNTYAGLRLQEGQKTEMKKSIHNERNHQLNQSMSQNSSQNDSMLIEEVYNLKKQHQSQSKIKKGNMINMRIDQEIIKDQKQQKQQHVFTPLISDYALMASNDRRAKEIESYEEQKSAVMSRQKNQNGQSDEIIRHYISNKQSGFQESGKATEIEISQPKRQKIELKKDLKLSSKIRYEDLRGYQGAFIADSNKYPLTSQHSQNINLSIDPDIHKRNIMANNLQHTSVGRMNNQHQQLSHCTMDGSRSTLSNYSQKLDDLRKRYGRLN